MFGMAVDLKADWSATCSWLTDNMTVRNNMALWALKICGKGA